MAELEPLPNKPTVFKVEAETNGQSPESPLYDPPSTYDFVAEDLFIEALKQILLRRSLMFRHHFKKVLCHCSSLCYGTGGGIRTHTDMLLRHVPPAVGLPRHCFFGTSGQIRTDTLTILSRLPLPLGYGGIYHI